MEHALNHVGLSERLHEFTSSQILSWAGDLAVLP